MRNYYIAYINKYLHFLNIFFLNVFIKLI